MPPSILLRADDSPLLLSNHDSTASVLVTCKPGHTLSDENVHAIVRLVQMSCTGLEEKNISVVDSQGDMLWDGQHGGMAGGADIAKQQRAIETSTRAELQAALNLRLRAAQQHRHRTYRTQQRRQAGTQDHVRTRRGADQNDAKPKPSTARAASTARPRSARRAISTA